MYTEAEIERAARILCEQYKVKPDEICEQSSHRVNGRMVKRVWLENYKAIIWSYLRVNEGVEAALKQASAAGVKP